MKFSNAYSKFTWMEIVSLSNWTLVRSRTEKYVAPLLEELEDLRNQLDQGRLASKRCL